MSVMSFGFRRDGSLVVVRVVLVQVLDDPAAAGHRSFWQRSRHSELQAEKQAKGLWNPWHQGVCRVQGPGTLVVAFQLAAEPWFESRVALVRVQGGFGWSSSATVSWIRGRSPLARR